MAIEFYVGPEQIASLSEKLLVRISSAQNELQSRTGVRIDLCSTTILAPEHAKIWRDSLQRLLPTLTSQPELQSACSRLIVVLESAISRNMSLRIEGE
jgi:hypothetical protein